MWPALTASLAIHRTIKNTTKRNNNIIPHAPSGFTFAYPTKVRNKRNLDKETN